MTIENWPNILKWCLVHEGGYVNHPRDPGGATNRGITQRVYNAWRTRNGVQPQSVRHITDEEVNQIYRRQYWDRVQGDELPSGLDYAVYDFAVNSGVYRAATYLQNLVGVTPDGVIGEITLAAIAEKDVEKLIIALCDKRMGFLRRLQHWPTFKTGWTRRVMGKIAGIQITDTGVVDRSVMLARKVPANIIPVPAPEVGSNKSDGMQISFWRALLELFRSL